MATVERALALLRQDEQLVELEALLAFLASFVLDSDVVRQIMRWDMAVLRESPWYQEILREGERQGWQQGKEVGRQEGRQEGRQGEGRSLILRLLTRRVGDLPPALTAQVQALSLAKLETLGDALLEFTELADLVNWLDSQGG